MGFSKFNRGSGFNVGSTEGYEYRKLEELYKEYGEYVQYPIRALYINETKFGESAVATTDGYFINLPSHVVRDVKEIIADEDLVNRINEGLVSIEIYEYFSHKYNGTFYGLKWVEEQPTEETGKNTYKEEQPEEDIPF